MICSSRARRPVVCSCCTVLYLPLELPVASTFAHGLLSPDGQERRGDEVADGQEPEHRVLVAGGDEEGDEVGRQHAAADAAHGFAETGARTAQFRGVLFGNVELADGEDGIAEEGQGRTHDEPGIEALHHGQQDAATGGQQGQDDVHGLAAVLFDHVAADHAGHGTDTIIRPPISTELDIWKPCP